MKKDKHEEIEVQDPPELGLMQSMPEYLQGQTGPILGAENVEPTDIILPRLQLCGKQTPQFDERNERYIEGLRQGDFFNSITREIYGPSINVVPLFELKTRARMRAYGDKEPPYCRSFDGKEGIGDPGGECRSCPMRQFTKDAKGKSIAPACTEFLNFVTVLMPEDAKATKEIWNKAPRIDTVGVLGFKRTSIQNGQQWLTLLQLRNRNWFAGVYKLTSVSKTDGSNSWWVPVVENAGWQRQEGYDLCKPFYESVKSFYDLGKLKVEVDEEQEREPGAEG